MTEDDDALHRKIASTLDRSTDSLDASVVQKLQEIRERTLQPVTREWRPALAVAAVLVLTIGFSWFSLLQQSNSVPEPVFAESYLSEEPDMLADWEMLAVIGEVPDA